MNSLELPQVLAEHEGPVVVIGASAWAANDLLGRISKQNNPLWIELQPSDLEDATAQGNKLAKAVEVAFGGPLFGYGMPFSYGLSILKKHQDLLGQYTIGLYGAEFGPAFSQALLELAPSGHRVILFFPELPLGFEDSVSGLAVLDIRDGSATAQSPVRADNDIGLEYEGVFNALIVQKRWVEALEWATLHVPEQAGRAIEAAASQLWAQGSSARLYRLLAKLPKQTEPHNLLARWKFAALLDLGQEAEMLDEVQAMLAQSDVPELRALYAQALYRVGDVEGAQREATTAAETQKSALSLYQLGYILQTQDSEAAIPVLRESLRIAETEGKIYESAQATLALAYALTNFGQYGEACEWASWGLKLCDQKGLANQDLRLALFNEWAFTRILRGETAGLESQLREQSEHLSNARSGVAWAFQTTLADLLLSEGRAREALDIYRELWSKVKQRSQYNFIADSYIRILLDLGAFDDAVRIARTAVQLTDGLPLVLSRRARMALAMATSIGDPAGAIGLLEHSYQETSSPLLAYQHTIAGLYLARTLLICHETTKLEPLLAELSVSLKDIGREGLRLMAGPSDEFKELFALIEGTSYPLELRFLGAQEVRLNGIPMQLRKRFLEMLSILVLNPEGVTPEELALKIYGERGNPETIRSDMSRLREVIPITPKPYRLQVAVWADFVELQRLIMRGKTREALKLYRGTLLGDSDSVAITEEREYLDHVLREAVMASRDPEALIGLAEKQREDLDLLERALQYLPKNDPRQVLIQARIRSISESWN